jgi:hypothetical protein
MGRKKGSKNIKRGRPKNIVVEVKEHIQPSDLKVTKFVGFCTECDFMITTNDVINDKFKCLRCDHKGNIKKLKPNIENEFKPMSKKEYLESTINAEHYQMPSLNPTEINPKDFDV